MDKVFSIVQLVIAIVLIVLVLIQEKGGGVGEAFGGGGGFEHQKRGIEKYLHLATIIGLALFIAISLANLVQ